MKVNILERGFRKRHPYKKIREALFRPYWFPVVNAGRELRDRDCTVSFYASLTPDFFDCDVAVLSSRTVDDLIAERGVPASNRAELCQAVKQRVGKVVWFDARDSAGNCQFDVLPHVDRYLKRQLYRDRSIYREALFHGRVYADYYHRTYGVTAEGDTAEPHIASEVALADDDLGKMAVAWGCGAEFHWPFLAKAAPVAYLARAAVSQAIGMAYPEPQTWSPAAARPHDFCALFDSNRYSVKSVGYQRQITLEAAQAIDSKTKITGRVPRSQFYTTLAMSKVTVSTFGWGEVCFREQEAAYCGSAILMADMSNIDTYPNLYVADEFYVPFQWDLSDFDEKLRALLSDDARRIDMAARAQNLLMAQWTAAGRHAFADRFVGLLGQSPARVSEPLTDQVPAVAFGSA